jgi:FtsZ-interacting cell division protein YlmF
VESAGVLLFDAGTAEAMKNEMAKIKGEIFITTPRVI